jgi:hypothetical protein
MKRIICYLRTIKEFRTFVNAYINFGAIYIAHNYKEIPSKNKNKQVQKQTAKSKKQTANSKRQTAKSIYLIVLTLTHTKLHHHHKQTDKQQK